MDSVSSPQSEVVATMEHVSKVIFLLQKFTFHLFHLICNFLAQNKLWEINFFTYFHLKST